MKMLLFVAVLAVLACLGVIIVAVLASKKKETRQDYWKQPPRNN